MDIANDISYKQMHAVRRKRTSKPHRVSRVWTWDRETRSVRSCKELFCSRGEAKIIVSMHGTVAWERVPEKARHAHERDRACLAARAPLPGSSRMYVPVGS